eukprot:TRINITY_DN47538_c0_g1_i1.p1 TRINITY_DN47538_c0_g1~~TRINITY_DN47538_c0_g1_i1.p1  ORF type:complete len:603 (-),score=156.23 TRINITY_DN47538_c0_g1_i1:94-1902(-)
MSPPRAALALVLQLLSCVAPVRSEISVALEGACAAAAGVCGGDDDPTEATSLLQSGFREIQHRSPRISRRQLLAPAPAPRLPLLPFPASLTLASGAAAKPLDAAALLGAEVSLGAGIRRKDAAVQALQTHLQGLALRGDAADAAAPKARVTIRLALHAAAAAPAASPESYRLEVAHDGVNISAPGPAGLFYAVQTFKQLSSDASQRSIPALVIEDAPRFEWRGLHLDVSRHFFGADKVKRLLETMAAFKLNRFHWHLTDDQGWRLPIQKYPLLTSLGASGNISQGAYTADEIKDVVAFARARHIEVIPEIDIPGHSVAAIAAYPDLGNTDDWLFQAPKQPSSDFGVHQFTLAPSNASFEFLDHVFETVSELFPGSFVHVGGDEAPTEQWSRSDLVRRSLRAVQITKPQGLFNLRLGELLEPRNKTIVVWDEAVHQPGLQQDAVVMAWRSVGEVASAASQGHRVVNTNQDAYYFDHYQGPEFTEPKAFCCYTSLSQVYAQDPMPAHLTPKEQALVLGAQGQLWSEYFPTWKHVEYMAFPRALALAERVWTPSASVVGFSEFQQRLEPRLGDLDRMGVFYRSLHESGEFAREEKEQENEMNSKH